MLSNFQLENISKSYGLGVVCVCMKDELPDEPQNGNYIINLQSASQGSGTH